MSEGLRKAVLYTVLGITCLYHLGIGVVSCLSPETTLQVGAYFYGVHADALTPQFVYMLKALGMYALFTGALLVLALREPERFRWIILACVGLLVMRATSRVLFFDALHDAFGISWGRNLINVVVLVSQAGLLLWGIGPTPAPATASATPQPLSFPDMIASASARILEPQFNASASNLSSGVR